MIPDDRPNRMPLRIGRFTVSINALHEDVDGVARLFGSAGVVVLRAESMFVYDHIEYMAYCPQFRVLSIGEMVPLYTMTATVKDGVQYVEFKEAT